MDPNPACPVCDVRKFEEVGRRIYRRAEMEYVEPSVRRRLEVLFNVWLDDSNEFELQWLMCQQCGMLIYSPRPSEGDLDRKYRHLTKTAGESRTTESTSHKTKVKGIEEERAARITSKLITFLAPGSEPPSQVLDYGGGDGGLVKPLAEAGADCYVVDYNETCVPGVTRLAQTLDELDDSTRFDLLICSHVLEHLADPLRTLTRLRRQLRDNGIGYFEVPMEIWKRPPKIAEPVTHVNFFTPMSFAHLCRRSAFLPVKLTVERAPHSASGHTLVICAVVKAGQAVANMALPPHAADATRKLLHPGLHEWLLRSMIHPSILPSAVWYQLKRRIRRILPNNK